MLCLFVLFGSCVGNFEKNQKEKTYLSLILSSDHHQQELPLVWILVVQFLKK